MNTRKKIRYLGILAFAPLCLFALWVFFYGVILHDFFLENRLDEHLDIAGLTLTYYTPLFILLAINFTVAFGAFIYFVYDIWIRTDVHAGNKIIWVLFMATFNLIAFPVYWYMHVKHDRVRNAASPALS